jgi:hypothetical protein
MDVREAPQRAQAAGVWVSGGRRCGHGGGGSSGGSDSGGLGGLFPTAPQREALLAVEGRRVRAELASAGGAARVEGVAALAHNSKG